MQSDPVGTMCTIGSTPPEEHALEGERAQISETIATEISEGKSWKGDLSLAPPNHTASYQGSRSGVLVDGVDTSDTVGPT
jgi:hypothetical protein